MSQSESKEVIVSSELPNDCTRARASKLNFWVVETWSGLICGEGGSQHEELSLSALLGAPAGSWDNEVPIVHGRTIKEATSTCRAAHSINGSYSSRSATPARPFRVQTDDCACPTVGACRRRTILRRHLPSLTAEHIWARLFCNEVTKYFVPLLRPWQLQSKT